MQAFLSRKQEVGKIWNVGNSLPWSLKFGEGGILADWIFQCFSSVERILFLITMTCIHIWRCLEVSWLTPGIQVANRYHHTCSSPIPSPNHHWMKILSILFSLHAISNLVNTSALSLNSQIIFLPSSKVLYPLAVFEGNVVNICDDLNNGLWCKFIWGL